MKPVSTMTSFVFLLFISSILHSYSSSAFQETNLFFNSSLGPTLKIYDVIKDFGAINDGKTDTTQAFLNAWNDACYSTTTTPSQILVPKGFYLLKPLTFKGPCNNLSVSILISGTLITYDYDSEFWISFSNVDGLRITGGVIDANGKTLWDCKAADRTCPMGAKSLVFDKSRNIIIDGLTSVNSQMFHIVMNTCENVNMDGININADGESPNTDGIHLQNSKGVTITNSHIVTGDDCISMGGNNQNIWIENIFCGPGHGISIGSLGHDGDEGILVQNVTVKTTTFQGTENGVRIKTMSTPINGNVRDIYFIGANMVTPHNPIIIDQNYCTPGNCEQGQGSGIQISNIVYTDIHGPSSNENIVTFDCSPVKPCNALTLQNVNLSYQSGTPKCVDKFAQLAVGSSLPPNCQVVTDAA